MIMVCPNCKSNIPDDTILCPHCSYNVPAASIDDSVLGIMKDKISKRIEKNEPKSFRRKPYKKYIFLAYIIVLLIQALLIKNLTGNNNSYNNYDGYLVEYDEENGKYTGIYEYKKDNEVKRTAYDQYYNTKEEVPTTLIIYESDNNKTLLNYNVIVYVLFVPYAILAVISVILDINYKNDLSNLKY